MDAGESIATHSDPDKATDDKPRHLQEMFIEPSGYCGVIDKSFVPVSEKRTPLLPRH